MVAHVECPSQYCRRRSCPVNWLRGRHPIPKAARVLVRVDYSSYYLTSNVTPNAETMVLGWTMLDPDRLVCVRAAGRATLGRRRRELTVQFVFRRR